MSELSPSLELVLAFPAFGLVTVLPGFAIVWLARRLAGRWRRRAAAAAGADRPAPAAAAARPGADVPAAALEADPAPLVLAVTATAIALALVGGLLLSLGEFSARRLAAVAVVTGLAGVPPCVAWLRTLRPARLTAVYLTALTLPYVASAMPVAKLAPASTFQWYYAELGRQLDATGGVPEWVSEYGRQVRWLPDYIFFNVVSEAYRGLTAFAPEARALALYRAPAALLGAISVYLFLRLWFRRPAAFAGVGATVASTAFIGEFDAYRPEGLALSLALLAAWLAVQALRRRLPSWLVLAGVVWAISLGMHAIGATIGGLLLIAAVAVEWLAGAGGTRTRALPALVAGGIAAAAVTLATGWALQGRAVVAGDATHARPEGSFDPGLAFKHRTDGDFNSSNRVGSGNTFPTEALDEAWPTLAFSEQPVAVALLALAIVGSLLALALGRGPPRRGVLVIAAYAVMLAAGIAFFALAFETYVPRHTGLSRFADYVPLAYAFAAGAGVHGALLAWERRTRRPAPDLSGAVAATLVVVATAIATGRIGPDPGLPGATRAKLGELTQLARPGEVVISNAATRGTLEFFTGLESPLEGRQPFLEGAGLLRGANRMLLDAHEWFRDPGELARLRRLGARWVIVVADPAQLGAKRQYAETPSLRPFRSQPALRERLTTPELAVFEFSGAPRAGARVGPPQQRFGRFVAALVGLGLALGLTALLLRRRARASSPALAP